MERGMEMLRPTFLIPHKLDITTILLGHWAQTQTIPDRTVVEYNSGNNFKSAVCNEL